MWRPIGLFILAALAGALISYERQPNYAPGCTGVAHHDRFHFRTEDGSSVRLEVRGYAQLRLDSSNPPDSCSFVRGLTLHFLYHNKKLVPRSVYGASLNGRKYLPVAVHIDSIRHVSNEVMERINSNLWKYESSVKHVRFPLEYYPKFLWDHPDSPSEQSLRLSKLDHIWGITGTDNKLPFSGMPFTAYCSIPVPDGTDIQSEISNEFLRYGDSKCRGSVLATEGDLLISSTVDVWAFLGSNNEQTAIEDIHLIYDNVVEVLLSLLGSDAVGG